MADVTFGVKVPEEMKNELSELMKESTVTGKEFMGMLIASYKLDKAKEESSIFDGDLKELQSLIKRVQSIFMNMMEKSYLQISEMEKENDEKMQVKAGEYEVLVEACNKKETTIEHLKEQLELSKKELGSLREQFIASQEEVETYKQQIKNQMLLYTKFEEEVKVLQSKIEGYSRLDEEIKERNEECTRLKNRNDEINSEIWFLKREIEKSSTEKEQLISKHHAELSQLKVQHELALKNELLEQKVAYTDEMGKLKEEINILKDKLIKYMDKMSD